MVGVDSVRTVLVGTDHIAKVYIDTDSVDQYRPFSADVVSLDYLHYFNHLDLKNQKIKKTKSTI